MKKLLVFLLIGFVAAGCTSAPRVPELSAQGPASATVGSVAPTLDATTTPGPASNGSASSSKPLAITVQPPSLQLGPGQGTLLPPQGWLTFTSPAMGVAVDYPAEWSVTEQGNAATFSSSQGSTIRLQAAGAQAEGSQCTTLINASGLRTNVCVDSATGLYSASFSLNSTDGSTKNWMLATTDLAAVDVYKSMINSLRSAP